MFTVYGVAGQVFNGTLEEMSRVSGLERARTVRQAGGKVQGSEHIDPSSRRLHTMPQESPTPIYFARRGTP